MSQIKTKGFYLRRRPVILEEDDWLDSDGRVIGREREGRRKRSTAISDDSSLKRKRKEARFNCNFLKKLGGDYIRKKVYIYRLGR